jgi:molybdopterin/thiamine biosynthesis adenylyltransferase
MTAGAVESTIDRDEFARHAYARNAGLIDAAEQEALGAMRMLVAGSGSVGGSVVEPLVRLGIGGLALADPDTYDLHNVNRQACTLADVGQPKVEVLAARAHAINPWVEVRTAPDGVTPKNAEELVSGSTIVFDGLDITQSALWAKWLVHRAAAERGLPVINAADLGGTASLFVFDYSRDPRPFLGRAAEPDFRGPGVAAALKIMGIGAMPTDFLAVIRDCVADGRPWPQVAYTADALGAMASRVAIDLAMGRRLPRRVVLDVHGARRTRRARLALRLRRPAELLRTALVLRRA